MTFQPYPLQVPYFVPDPPRSNLDIERLEIMRAVNEARRIAKAERQEVKRLRSDVRRLERMSPIGRRRRLRLPLTQRQTDQADQDQLEKVDYAQR